MKFVNYAHRGASSYAPENTMSSFRLGLQMGANGIETDVQRTRDGVLVLFHDDTLARVTGQPGSVKDYTYAQLQEFAVTVHGKSDRIPTLEEFLQAFGQLDLTFAIELKQPFTEADTMAMLEKYNMKDKTVVTSFRLECLMRARAAAPDYRLGYLTEDLNALTEPVMEAIGIREICPEAPLVTAALVEHFHSKGYSVRAWGIRNEDLMQAVYDAGADGMTVNFPDKLTAYMAK
jgi:glycerophosphoryl diester phosphodiesterase